MAKLRRVVEAAGYPTWARTYPSRKMPVDELAAQVADWINSEVQGPVSAITHSLGGVLSRFIGDRVAWERVVMLAPPNRGSRVAATLAGNPMYRWYFGPVGSEMSDPAGWPPGPPTFGVISGTKRVSVGNLPSWVTAGLNIIPKNVPSDGTVCVDETKLESMADYAEVPASHTWIMNHPETHALALEFLASGRFTAAT